MRSCCAGKRCANRKQALLNQQNHQKHRDQKVHYYDCNCRRPDYFFLAPEKLYVRRKDVDYEQQHRQKHQYGDGEKFCVAEAEPERRKYEITERHKKNNSVQYARGKEVIGIFFTVHELDLYLIVFIQDCFNLVDDDRQEHDCVPAIMLVESTTLSRA